MGSSADFTKLYVAGKRRATGRLLACIPGATDPNAHIGVYNDTRNYPDTLTSPPNRVWRRGRNFCAGLRAGDRFRPDRRLRHPERSMHKASAAAWVRLWARLSAMTASWAAPSIRHRSKTVPTAWSAISPSRSTPPTTSRKSCAPIVKAAVKDLVPMRDKAQAGARTRPRAADTAEPEPRGHRVVPCRADGACRCVLQARQPRRSATRPKSSPPHNARRSPTIWPSGAAGGLAPRLVAPRHCGEASNPDQFRDCFVAALLQ